jgi:hypothetical protein
VVWRADGSRSRSNLDHDCSRIVGSSAETGKHSVREGLVLTSVVHTLDPIFTLYHSAHIVRVHRLSFDALPSARPLPLASVGKQADPPNTSETSGPSLSSAPSTTITILGFNIRWATIHSNPIIRPHPASQRTVE